MFGAMTRKITVPQPAPRLRAASESVLTSIAERPASSARYANGSTRMRYANETRKKAAPRTRTMTRNTRSLSRRARVIGPPGNPSSSKPPRRPPLKQGIQRHHDRHDHDHAKGQRLRESRVVAPGLTGEKVADRDRHDWIALADEGGRGGVGGEGVGEEQQRGAEEGGGQKRTGDIAPVVPGAAAKAFGRLSPLRADAVECRQKDEDHQRDLKVGIDQHQTRQLREPHAIREDVDAALLKPQPDETDAPDGGDEGEGQRHATELGEHATCG